jgi:hypothetical protein
MLIEEGEAADAVRRRLPPIDMEPDGTKPNSKKAAARLHDPPAPRILFNDARNKVALRFDHVRSGATPEMRTGP